MIHPYNNSTKLDSPKSDSCSNINECYICCKECFRLSPCDCKSLYLHLNCQYQIVTKSNKLNKAECSVCKKNYTNIIITQKEIKKFTILSIITFNIFIFLSIICVSTGVSYYILNKDDNFTNAIIFGVIFNITIFINTIFVISLIIYKIINYRQDIFFYKTNFTHYLLN
jgi:hypothetical protein